MIQTANGERRGSFSHWLRTGRLPAVQTSDGIELKFNPWHDPDDGRFTFAGTGQHFGSGKSAPINGSGDDSPTIVLHDDPSLPKIGTKAEADGWRDRTIAKHARNPKDRALIEAKYREYLGKLRPRSDANRLAEFGAGVGHGLYDVGRDTVMAVSSAATDPVGTLRNTRDGIVSMIDTALVAENTPAHVQVSSAARAIVDASAREIGHAVGSIAGNVALAAIPGVAATKLSALRRARMARPRRTFHMPDIGWVKETHSSKAKWVDYNNSAPGARPGLAPTLKREVQGRSRPFVKFDGIRGDYLIDRKWSVSTWPDAVDQMFRQSEVLRNHHMIGVWEVPTRKQYRKALRLFKKHNIRNIHVGIVKP